MESAANEIHEIIAEFVDSLVGKAIQIQLGIYQQTNHERDLNYESA
jgi:hypothetical protein